VITPKHPKAAWFVQQRLLEGVEVFADLEARISSLATTQERGDAFDVFAEAYLATQPLHQALEVWPLTAVSPSLRRRAGLEDRDFGVDGLFRTSAESLCAYQVKFRSGRTPLVWSELSTFMGLADQVDQRVLFTNSDELPLVMKRRKRFYAVRGTDLDRLQPDDFAVLRGWLAGVIVHRSIRTPRPDQEEALADIVPALKKIGSRATITMACGSGKTLVGIWAAQRLRSAKTLVLLPSLALLSQTLRE